MTKALILGALLLAGCELSSGDLRRKEMHKVQYWHDPQAELCFAEYRIERSYGFFVSVPCTGGLLAKARTFDGGRQ